MTILRMTEEEYADHTRGGTTGDAESSRTAAVDAGAPSVVQDRLFDLRDYFAGQALNGVCAEGHMVNAADAATWSYELADAMLKERDKGTP